MFSSRCFRCLQCRAAGGREQPDCSRLAVGAARQGVSERTLRRTYLLEPELDEPEELEAPADPADPELLSPPDPPDLPVEELAAWPLLVSTLPVVETLSFLATCFLAFFTLVAWVVVSVDDAVGLLSASFIAMVDDFVLSLEA